MIKLNRSNDAAQAADAMAIAVARDLTAALTTRPRALFLVSGGRSPLAFFDALKKQPIDWSRIDVSLADERSVPPDHADANARLVREHLLVGPAEGARWIGLMPQPASPRTGAQGADGAEVAHDAWQQAQHAVERANADVQLRQAAVIVLGLGNDGHTASLFPDSPQWLRMQSSAASMAAPMAEPMMAPMAKRYVAVQPQQAPHARISLSLQALHAQGRCYLWAVGADKMATLERLQLICRQGDGQAAHAANIAAAGPVACLIAAPDFLLDVYCSDVA